MRTNVDIDLDLLDQAKQACPEGSTMRDIVHAGMRALIDQAERTLDRSTQSRPTIQFWPEVEERLARKSL